MEPTISLRLSRKQKLALDLLEDQQIIELDFGGAAGGAKSWTVVLWMLMQCRQYPGIRIGLGRKELTRLKQTTLMTIVREVHPMLGIQAGEYTYQDQKGLLTYKNGSEIQLYDLARQPSDPDYDTLGSLNLTHVVIEEVGEIHHKAKVVFGSRKNRWLNDKYNITGKVVLTQNPSQNFTRQEFYDPYIRAGGGDYQKWPIGNVYLNNVKMTAYRCFIKSLPTDNPFIPKNYIEDLKRLPPQERKRLFEGNWDYTDDDDMLFKSELLDKAIAYEYNLRESPMKFFGVDVADKGKDKTIVSMMVDGVLTRQKRINVDTTGDKPISYLYALELIKFAQQEGLTPQMARQIAIEGNGVGVGMRDAMRTLGWFATEYTATSISRSQGYYDYHLDMDSGDARIDSKLETMAELRIQLTTHTYEMNEKLQPVVLSKKKIKEIIGHSPDEADSAMICNWARRLKGGDPKYDQSRIVF